MTEISKEEVKHIADLAKLPLSDEETGKLAVELSDTISHINILSKLNLKIKNLSETSQISGLRDIFREDVIDSKRILPQKEALSNCKNTHGGYFVVKRILG
ncbi:MAG: Asp-tRNA(Asn)/Glu-tRNA(Gln) amidotransferase subunit GatC [Patescibacteria group bacterium]|nr:Asp-tRNA(Asn)/Glu-tRNA(Gln) amidotransferase subunit GatC [Patescibacteria group bacterium]